MLDLPMNPDIARSLILHYPWDTVTAGVSEADSGDGCTRDEHYVHVELTDYETDTGAWNHWEETITVPDRDTACMFAAAETMARFIMNMTMEWGVRYRESETGEDITTWGLSSSDEVSAFIRKEQITPLDILTRYVTPAKSHNETEKSEYLKFIEWATQHEPDILVEMGLKDPVTQPAPSIGIFQLPPSMYPF